MPRIMMSPVLLIVGLGNPGERYADTRHNAGLNFLQQVASDVGATFRYESKFEGSIANATVDANEVRLFAPGTYMNESGRAIAKVVRFFKVPTEQLLVAHDELDLPPGTVRLKRGGGHGGHNGLRDIFPNLGSQDFMRLRIGIGHPGSADRVVDYVLHRPSREDADLIQKSIGAARRELSKIVRGDTDLAMNVLHAKAEGGE